MGRTALHCQRRRVFDSKTTRRIVPGRAGQCLLLNRLGPELFSRRASPSWPWLPAAKCFHPPKATSAAGAWGRWLVGSADLSLSPSAPDATASLRVCECVHVCLCVCVCVCVASLHRLLCASLLSSPVGARVAGGQAKTIRQEAPDHLLPPGALRRARPERSFVRRNLPNRRAILHLKQSLWRRKAGVLEAEMPCRPTKLHEAGCQRGLFAPAHVSLTRTHGTARQARQVWIKVCHRLGQVQQQSEERYLLATAKVSEDRTNG
ncbi:unnamed protein product [Protopolystoma xenopodis]|uniref:Uncharacterized protein n=1 Tax=Protopolystoma xenopodis TaxID=117903 RepID=A0A3S5CEK4_9PLAT|nr:unnamed protein product [Protopolystoma xenopodis]